MRWLTVALVCALTPALTAAEFEGVVAAAEEYVLTIPSPAVVDEIHVKPGDHVRKGDVLAVMDTTQQRLELEQALAKYRLAEVQLVQLKAAIVANRSTTEAELQRIQQLREKEVVTQAEVDQVEQEMSLAKANMAQVQSKETSLMEPSQSKVRIAEAELEVTKTAIEAGRYRIERGTLRSPVSGTVLDCNFQKGTLARPGETRISVADLENLTVKALVPEAKLRVLQNGLECGVETSVGTLAGRIGNIAPRVENGHVAIIVEFEASDVKLLPGMKATVRLAMPDAQ